MVYNEGAKGMAKRKIPFSEVANLGYYKFAKGVWKGVKGFFYWVDTLSNEDQTKVERYNNTEILKSKCEFAPEIKSSVIFVGDKCF